jgi:hypothetical protein
MNQSQFYGLLITITIDFLIILHFIEKLQNSINILIK